MEERDFDVLGVRSDETGTWGFLEAPIPTDGECSNHARPFLPGELISDSTPLLEVLHVLRFVPRMFVISGHTVYGIVTRADLQKAAVRIFTFGLISVLEMELTATIRSAYQPDEWQESLSRRRLEAANELFQLRQRRNEELSLLDCLQLCDKRDLVAKREALREQFGFTSRRETESFFKKVEDLRNRVAHSQDLVAGSSWKEVIDLLQEVDMLLQRL